MFVRTHLFRTGAGGPWLDSEARPRELLLAALGACTVAAVTQHARRREWELGEVTIEMSHVDDEGVMRIGRLLQVDAPLDAEQREELARLCDDTPVTRVVATAARISTLIQAPELVTDGRRSGDRGGPREHP